MSKEKITQVLQELKFLGKKEYLEGMRRFGIVTESALGINIPTLRNYARAHKNNHELALQLWDSGIHEARLLATFIDDPKLITEAQMEEWVLDFNSWDICDQCCGNIFDRTPYACNKADQWVKRKEEYVKRAGFVLMATLAVHDKKLNDEIFIRFLSIIQNNADDERNFVKKAVNWALRQIGKRNKILHEYAIATAEAIQEQKSKSSKWIAADALREFANEKIKARVMAKK